MWYTYTFYRTRINESMMTMTRKEGKWREQFDESSTREEQEWYCEYDSEVPQTQWIMLLEGLQQNNFLIS